MATSGAMTVYYFCNGQRGFNASFSILQCPYNCDATLYNRECNERNQCVCKGRDGYQIEWY